MLATFVYIYICHPARHQIAHRGRRVHLNQRRGRPSSLAVPLPHRRATAAAVPDSTRCLRDEALSRRERASVGTVRGDCFGGDAAARRDRAVAMQAPLSAGVNDGPAGSAEGIVASGAPLDGDL